jgi:hypothetical protein
MAHGREPRSIVLDDIPEPLSELQQAAPDYSYELALLQQHPVIDTAFMNSSQPPAPRLWAMDQVYLVKERVFVHIVERWVPHHRNRDWGLIGFQDAEGVQHRWWTDSWLRGADKGQLMLPAIKIIELQERLKKDAYMLRLNTITKFIQHDNDRQMAELYRQSIREMYGPSLQPYVLPNADEIRIFGPDSPPQRDLQD